MLELLKRCSAEVGVEPLAVDRDCLEPAQVSIAGYFVVLVPLIAFQSAQFDPFGAAVEKVGVVVRVLGCNQNHVDIGAVGRLEVCQAQEELDRLRFGDDSLQLSDNLWGAARQSPHPRSSGLDLDRVLGALPMKCRF